MDEHGLTSIREVYQRYRTLVLSLITGVALAIFIFLSWNYYQEVRLRKIQLASNAYVGASFGQKEQKDIVNALQSALETIDQAPFSLYPTFARLKIAKHAFDTQSYDAALDALLWVSEHAPDQWYQWVAKIRLSRIYQFQNKLDLAEAILEGDAPAVLRAAVANERGNVFYQSDAHAEAATHWETAIELSDDEQLKTFYQIKLHDARSQLAE